jgi:hypothetical protein
MIAATQVTDTGTAAEAGRVLQHPAARAWAPITGEILAEIAAGRWPLPPLMARRLVVRARRSLEACR